MRWRRWLVIAAVVATVAFVGARLPLLPWTEAAVDAIRGAGPWGVVVYVLASVAAGWVAVPAAVAFAVGGFVWGPVWGIVYGWIGGVISGSADFVVARRLLRRHLTRGWDEGSLWRRLDGHLVTDGLFWVTLLRAPPTSPYHFVSFMLGCTSVSTRDYVWGSALGLVPTVATFALAGASLTDLADLADGGSSGWTTTIAFVLTLVAGAVVTWRVRAATREMVTDASGGAAR